MGSVSKFLNFVIFHVDKYNIKVYTILIIILIVLIARLITWVIKKALFNKQNKSTIKLDKGTKYSVFQIIKYLVWIIAIVAILQNIGINVSVLIAGSAALLVGVGLGLQQTFNDIISGIILLSERSIKVGDILEIDSDIVRIQEIGLRTSVGLDRDEIAVIIPNSLITTNKVVNWSHQSRQTRFKIDVGVAYGSDTDKVIRLIKESAIEHKDVSDMTTVDVRFTDFGSSSLNFQLLFYSENIFRIEKVKSDIRLIMNRKFVENQIVVSFPQLDVHFDREFIDK